MSERKKIVGQIMDKDCICEMWKFAQKKLHLDIETEEGVTILTLLALAWITGAHEGLAFSEMTAALLADSDEVFHLVSDTWANILASDFPPGEIDRLVQTAMEAEKYRPAVSLVPKDFSFDLKSN